MNENIIIRTAQWSDVQGVAKLVHAVDEAEGDAETSDSAEEIEHGWHAPGFNPETDAFVAETAQKEIVGYWEVFNSRHMAQLELDGYVHPSYKNANVGERLIQRAEERAWEIVPLVPAEERVYIRSGMHVTDKYFRALHEKSGYAPIRYYWRMEIDLENSPTIQPLPTGLEFRPFDKETQLRMVWEVENETFRDHWGSHESQYEEWYQRKVESPEFDPTLWLVAWAGDEIAGISQNRYLNEMGWIGTLGVRRAWRKKGLGLAFLTQSFAEFYKRGTKKIGLGVDAANPTGATRLYEKAGMSVANEYVSYEKELRVGK